MFIDSVGQEFRKVRAETACLCSVMSGNSTRTTQQTRGDFMFGVLFIHVFSR